MSPAGADINFTTSGTTIDGAGALAIMAGTGGAIQFTGAVGSVTPLTSLDTQAGGGIFISASQSVSSGP